MKNSVEQISFYEDLYYANSFEDSNRELNKYIPISNNIPIYFALGDEGLELKKELNVFLWAPCFTMKKGIYLCITKKHGKFNEFLLHEMFHYSVFKLFGEKKTIPVWLNEALAYGISSDMSVDVEIVSQQLNHDMKNLKINISNDTYIDYTLYTTSFIKALGAYIISKYPSYSIKLFLEAIANGEMFFEQFKKTFFVSIDKLIEDFKSWFQSSMDLFYPPVVVI